MNMTILDVEATYKRLLYTRDEDTRRTIFEDELVKPFAGLAQMFGGDGLAAFKQWGMTPDQFSGEAGAEMARRIAILSEHRAWEQAAEAVECARAAFAKHADLSHISDIVFALLLVDMSRLPMGEEYAGFGAIPGYVMVSYGKPTEFSLARVKACTAHEMHHQFVGWLFGQGYIVQNVANYMVNEGLAESFGAELYGADKIGPWVIGFDMSRLDETKSRFRENFGVTGFDEVRKYIFGDIMHSFSGAPKTGITPYAGYALGYHTVQAYLKRTGKSVVEATLVPPMEVIEESGYFS